MKKLLIIILFPSILFSQYSNYYQVDKNVRVSGNLNISTTERKTIRTIDYGALAEANALREKNRLERLKYKDEQDKIKAYEVALDPLKSYDYGEISWTWWDKNLRKIYGKIKRKHKFDYIRKPYLLFDLLRGTYINVSDDNITTTMITYGTVKRIPGHILEDYEINLSVEQILKKEKLKVGEYVMLSPQEGGLEGYLHKKDINRAVVFGEKGFVGTYALEDDYEYTIVDAFVSPNRDSEYLNIMLVTYSGDKDLVDFEKLEGRRYYLKQLINKVVMNAFISGR